MSRSLARELGMQLIFQMDVQNEFDGAIRQRFLDESKVAAPERKYIEALTDELKKNLADIDALIDKYSAGWPASRMAKVDLAIARLAVTEIAYLKDVPVAVSINEAVELAKKYGGDSSPKFLNGLLGKIARSRDAAAGDKADE